MAGILVCAVAILAFVNPIAKTSSYGINDVVEDFTLTNVDGADIQLSTYMGEKGAIIIFTCNTCPYAQLYEDRIIDMHNTYAEQGYPVLAINPNDPSMKPGDSFEKMQARAEEKSFPFPYVFDEAQEVFPKFGATRTPHVFLIDGEMKLRYVGGIDDNPQNASAVKTNYVASAIEAIQQGADPDPQTTKAIGCGIKYRKQG